MDLQFYPTPPLLAARAWSMFKDRDFALVLEPSAGRGDLAHGRPRDYDGRYAPKVQCIELDVQHHDTLRKDFDVIGLDFMQEKLDRELGPQLNKMLSSNGRRWWDDPRRALNAGDSETAQRAHEQMCQALDAVHERHGISLGDRIAAPDHDELPLLLAA